MGGGRIGGDPRPVLLARGISKRYGGTRALEDAGVEVRAGEVHALVGRNGSGKSTLVRILSGAEAPDAGTVIRAGGRAGVVHQDLALIPALSVLENLRLSSLAARRGARISWRGERRRAAEALARLGIELDVGARVASLSLAERVQLAVARALDDLEGGPGRALVLDETTAGLPAAEARRLAAVVRAAAARGAGVLLVTHDLAEARDVGDRVTVLRDGRVAAVLPAGEASEAHLAELILGAAPPEAPPRGAPAGPVVARVGGLDGDRVTGLGLELRAGELVGLTGGAGTGWMEVPYLIAGARRARAGVLELGGERLELGAMTPARAAAAGIALIPADRGRDGLAGALSAGDNVTLSVLPRLVRRLRLDRRALAADAAARLDRAGVRPPGPRRRADTLSGGNQQRAMLAKGLATSPRLVLADEPLQGIDVGGRPAVVALLRAAAASGAAVLCSGGDAAGLREFCDRIVVLGEGPGA